MMQHSTSQGSIFARFGAFSASRSSIFTFKRVVVLSLLLAFWMMSGQVMGQLTGTKTVPGDYATVAAAVTDLNAQGVGAGGVTFNVAAGHTETAPAGGITITATGTMANPIVFQKNGAGPNPEITADAALTAGTLHDAIIEILGGDFITIDGFTLLENAANTTTAAGTNNMTEWGIALLYATTTDGAQNVTIKNCTIDLNRTYQNTFGIYSNSTHTATTISTGATATTAAGGNSGLKIHSNTITDVNIGIVVVGPTAAADHNDGLEVGGTMPTGNTITNFGTTGTFSGYINVSGTVNGVLVRNTKNFTVSYNSISSSVGGVTAGTLNGIQVPAFSNAPTGTFTNSINNNSISLQSGAASGAMNGINVLGTSSTITSTTNINNNDFNNFGHTVAGTATIQLIALTGTATAGPLTTNINNNTFTNITVNTTGSFTFIANSWTRPAGGIINVNNNSVVTQFTKTGSGGTVFFYNNFGSSPATVTETNTGNNFSNLTFTGATISGWRSADGSTPGSRKTVTGNTFNNITNNTSGAISSILYVGFSDNTFASNNVSGNTISTITGAGAVVGIFSDGQNQNFFNNTVSGLTSSGASPVTGISLTGATVQNIYKNKIYGLSGTNAGSTVNGILFSAGTTFNIYNNLIGELSAPNASGNDVIRGINSTSTTATSDINISFNSIHINASSAGTNFGTSGIFHTTNATATTATLNLKNNIIVNTSVPAGTGLTVAYRRSSTDLTNYGSVSNNNLFYAGTPSAANLIFHDGTNSDQTLGDYKGRVSPRDASSISENPNFLSTMGASADFLHINTGIPSQIESGGMPVAGITDDFDGNSRNATTPDIGADEFAGLGQDLTPPNIAYTPLIGKCGAGAATLTTTITDASGVPTAGLGLPVAYWSINSATGPFTASTATYLGSDQYQFSLGTGAGVGDVVHYYVVAQDNAGVPNVGSNPSGGAGGFTTNPPAAVTPPTVPNSYANVSDLSGTYTVGSGGDYATLTDAVADYNVKCLSGPVVFELIDAGYPSETFPISINAVAGTDATNTLTIRPAAGNVASISGSSASCIIRLNGADWVILDGSNSGGTDRSLTIENTSTATNTAAICVSSLGTGAGATNNTIKNCNTLTGANAPASNTFGIHVAGTTVSTTATGNDNDNLTIQNNSISKSSFGIYAQATSAGVNDNLLIIGNDIGSNNTSNFITNRGILFSQATNANVSENTIFNMIVSAITATLRAIESGAGVTNTSISRNHIYEIANTSINQFRAGQGISVNSGSAGTGVTIANNMISALKGDGSGTLTNNSWGIMVLSGGGYTIAYNSIHIPDNRLTTTSIDLHGGIHIASTANTLTIKNNIISVTGNPGNAASGKMYGIHSLAASPFTVSNNNNLFVSGGRHHTGLFGGSDRTTLANWQVATGQDANSLSIATVFASATDLHILPFSNLTLDAAGMPVAGVTIDFDGDLRNATTPDIGADEFDPPPPCSGTPTPGNTLSSANPACAGIDFTLSLSNSPLPALGYTYQWQSSPNNMTWTNIMGATNASLTTSLTVATWYRCVVTCSFSTLSANSTPLLVTKDVFSNCYCTTSVTNSTLEKIANVTFNTINNSSSSTAGYEDFTAISTNLLQEETFNLSVTLSDPFISDQIIVWIDYNQNGFFTDAGEMVFMSPTGLGPYSGDITIPLNSTPGATRMRIRLHDSANGPNNTPCGNSDWGQVEDYTVIIDPCTTFTWYADADGDTWGDIGSPLIACNQPMGYVLNKLDCDDTNNMIFPNSPELCDGLDNDCSGAPESATNTYVGLALGNASDWSDGANWSDKTAPLECQHVVIPGSFTVNVPLGYEGKGLTLDVGLGVTLTVPIGALLTIIHP